MERDELQTKIVSVPQRWAVILSILLSLIALGKSVFLSGGEMGSINAHLEYDDKRIDTVEMQQRRTEDRIEGELQLLRQSVQASQDAANRENELLTELERKAR